MQRRFSLSVRKGTTSRVPRGETFRTSGSTPDPVAPPPAAAPPVSSQLDRVLQKAANKHSLSHPSAPPPKQEPQGLAKETPRKVVSQPKRGKRPAPRPAAAHKQQQRKQKSGVDNSLLPGGITESERDSVWQAIKLEVEGNDTGDEWLEDDLDSRFKSIAPARRRAAPASARYDGPSASAAGAAQPVASTSGFKGFGAPPSRLNAAAPAHQDPGVTPSRTQSPAAAPPAGPAGPEPQPHSTSETAPASGPAPGLGPRQQPKRHGPLRLFLFNAEEARTRALLLQLGLAGRVQVVPELRDADAILAAKLTRSGKHANLTQGEKTAANAGIPFLVVGRNLSAQNLEAALAPLLDPRAAAAAAAAAAARAPSAAELHAHRMEVFQGFGQLIKAGALPLRAEPAAPPASTAQAATALQQR